MNPKYPVYVISKGRWRWPLTARALEACHVPYRIVIEPQEYDQYAAIIDPENILILPFSNLGQGSIPARNWVWEHAISLGVERHWILDDNIRKNSHRAVFGVSLWQDERDTITPLSREEARALYECLPVQMVEYEEAFDIAEVEEAAGRPTYYGKPMKQTAIWLPEEMIEWLKSQPGTMSETIRELISCAMNTSDNVRQD